MYVAAHVVRPVVCLLAFETCHRVAVSEHYTITTHPQSGEPVPVYSPDVVCLLRHPMDSISEPPFDISANVVHALKMIVCLCCMLGFMLLWMSTH
jgi:hypothetical protein